MCDQQSLRPACAYAIEHHLEFLSLKVGCTGSSESTHAKMPHSWKSHVMAHMLPAGWLMICNCAISSCIELYFDR